MKLLTSISSIKIWC